MSTYSNKYEIVKPIFLKHPISKLNHPWKILYEILLLGNDLPKDLYHQYSFYKTYKNIYNLISIPENLQTFEDQGDYLLKFKDIRGIDIVVKINTYYINYAKLR